MNKKHKLRRLSQLGKPKIIDSLEIRNLVNTSDGKKNTELLDIARNAWDNLYKFRERRDRCLRYTYGDQWSDIVKNEFGDNVTERQSLSQNNATPLVNNLIRRLVNNLVGTKIKQATEPIATARDRDEQQLGEQMTVTLQYNWQLNQMDDLLSSAMEEFLISGFAAVREIYDTKSDKPDVFTELINPNYIFFESSMLDPRHWDLTMIGQIHDITLKELIATFAKTEEQSIILQKLYSTSLKNNSQETQDIDTRHAKDNLDFYSTYLDRCRVYEIWTQEIKTRYKCHDWLSGEYYKIEIGQINEIKQENNSRISLAEQEGIPLDEVPLITYEQFTDRYWYYQFLSTDGTILKEGETPYAHKSHPFTIKAYPMINGEIHSFVNDIIDQQRYINRLITLNDFIIKSSAKGITFVDEKSIPDGMTPEAFAKQWIRHDGFIYYKSNPNITPPQQIANNSTNIGTNDMLQLQLKLIEDISGVHGAMQGKSPKSNTSASLYAQQAANGSTSIMTVLTKFQTFENELAKKKNKMIQQYYNEKKVINIAGTRYGGIKIYDPEQVKNIDFDVNISESISTPVYRSMTNDVLMELLKMNQIDISLYLENSSLPFADQLLQSLNAQQEQQQEMMQQASQNGMGNPNLQQIEQQLRK